MRHIATITVAACDLVGIDSAVSLADCNTA